MNLFKYLDSGKSYEEVYDIYSKVRSNEAYARKIYGGNWEDALDAAFFHVLDKYDSSVGDLDNYITVVVKTILLNKDKKEYANDEKAKKGLDSKEYIEYKGNEIDLIFEDDRADSVRYCVKDMLEMFIEDYKFFKTGKSRDRKNNYGGIFSKYSYDVISDSKDYLVTNYLEEVYEFMKYSRQPSVRLLSCDRYNKSLDSNLVYKSEINGTVIIKRRKGSHYKNLYRVDLSSMLGVVVNLLYGRGSLGRLDIEGVTVYISLTGKIVFSLDTLKKLLEEEIIGVILTNSYFKIVNHTVGDNILLSGTKDSLSDIVIPVFDRHIPVFYSTVVFKEELY